MGEAVQMTLRNTSDCNFRYDLIDEVPHLADWQPGGLVIAPRSMLLRFTSAQGQWDLDLASVFGLPVINGKVKERKRHSAVTFPSPLDGEGPDMLPQWLGEIAEHHVRLMNGSYEKERNGFDEETRAHLERTFSPQAVQEREQRLHERQDEAARNAAREMFSLASTDMADELAYAVLTAVRKVG